jgi:hypothetical protein
VVYNTKKLLFFEGALFIIRYCKILENTLFWKLDLLPSSGEVEETPNLLDPLKLCSLVFLGYQDDGQCPKTQ